VPSLPTVDAPPSRHLGRRRFLAASASSALTVGALIWWAVSRDQTTSASGIGRRSAPGTTSGPTALSGALSPARTRSRGQLLASINGHTDIITALLFHPALHLLVSASRDSTIRLWDVADATKPTPVGNTYVPDGIYRTVFPTDSNPAPPSDTPASVWSLAFRPDGKVLAGGNGNGTVRVWSVTDPAGLTAVGQPLAANRTIEGDLILDVTFSADGRTLASASSDGTVRLWDLTDPANAKLVSQPAASSSNVSVPSVAFSPVGNILAAAGREVGVRLWDVTDPTAPIVTEPTGFGNDPAFEVAFSPDGRIFASKNNNGVHLWGFAHRASMTPGPAVGAANASGIVFSSDGRMMAEAANGVANLWNVSDLTHPVPLAPTLSQAGGPMAFGPDGKVLATVDSGSETLIQLWEVG
jgi:WD40 repeat protein